VILAGGLAGERRVVLDLTRQRRDLPGRGPLDPQASQVRQCGINTFYFRLCTFTIFLQLQDYSSLGWEA
jgi:hypothetical protein